MNVCWPLDRKLMTAHLQNPTETTQHTLPPTHSPTHSLMHSYPLPATALTINIKHSFSFHFAFVHSLDYPAQLSLSYLWHSK